MQQVTTLVACHRVKTSFERCVPHTAIPGLCYASLVPSCSVVGRLIARSPRSGFVTNRLSVCDKAEPVDKRYSD